MGGGWKRGWSWEEVAGLEVECSDKAGFGGVRWRWWWSLKKVFTCWISPRSSWTYNYILRSPIDRYNLKSLYKKYSSRICSPCLLCQIQQHHREEGCKPQSAWIYLFIYVKNMAKPCVKVITWNKKEKKEHDKYILRTGCIIALANRFTCTRAL